MGKDSKKEQISVHIEWDHVAAHHKHTQRYKSSVVPTPKLIKKNKDMPILFPSGLEKLGGCHIPGA